MDEREREHQVLERCAAVGKGLAHGAKSSEEANVFRVAAMIVQHRFPEEARRLLAAAEAHFAAAPETNPLHTSEVVRRGWVNGLPRFRDMLFVKLK
jgi:hypothetical protein